jgi:SP family general alpha glucoside:H+ symporter-like MFS transporter
MSVNPPNPVNPDSKDIYGGAPEVEGAKTQIEHVYDLDEKAKVADYKADAVEAENTEHNMGVMEAVRAYPMASFWAFVMSFTIVRGDIPLILHFPRASHGR